MSSITQAYGANIAFIEELYEKYRSNPDNVSASWREFFEDYHGGQAILPDLGQAGSPVLQPAPPPPRPTAVPPPAGNVMVLRGAAGQIAQNREGSLGGPTATSVRT